MSSLLQIESAIAGLPPQQQWLLLSWLQSRLAAEPATQATTPEALQVFRQLQAEVGLSPERATAWKDAVAAGRR
jgi:hypothetical protein